MFRDALRGASGARRAADRLCGEGQPNLVGAAHPGAARAPGPTRSPRARSAARWPPACRRSGSSSPASARPPASWPSRSRPASPRSTSSPSRSSTCWPQLAAEQGVRAGHRHPGQSRTSAPAATPRSPPATRESKFGVSLGEAERLYAKASQHRLAAAGRRRLPHRQPDHRPGAAARRLRADARPGRAAARRGADASSGSTSAAAWACPISTSPTRRRRRDYAAMVGRGGAAAWTSSWPSSPAG